MTPQNLRSTSRKLYATPFTMPMKVMETVSEPVIFQTNQWVWLAIAAVRVERNPVTMGGLHDALRKRRSARAYREPQWMKDAWAALSGHPYAADFTHAEKISFINSRQPCQP